jgi:flagellar biosynthetic protein FliQ
MTQQMVVFLARRSLLTALFVAGPILGAGLLIGLVVALFQAVTQIREMTLTMIPKILVVGAVTFWLLPWMLKVMVAYTTRFFQWSTYYGT